MFHVHVHVHVHAMLSNQFPERRAFPEWRAPSPGKDVLSNDAYKFTRVLWGTTVPNIHQVLLEAVAVPTSFALAARHGDGVIEALEEGMARLALQESSLLNTILPYARGFSDIDLACVARVRLSILAGEAVHESAPYAGTWKNLQNNSSHIKIAQSRIKGRGLFWKPHLWYWPADEPLYVYGGFEVPGGCTDALETTQDDYLLHVQGSGQPGSYICGKPWNNMPGTHVGGYANHHVPPGRACTVVRWIPLGQLLPSTMRDWLVKKKLLHSACGAMAIPIVHALNIKPDQWGELTMNYGSDPEAACPGIKRARGQ